MAEFYVSREDYQQFNADAFEQQARSQVADTWETHVRRLLPDMMAQASQQAQQQQMHLQQVQQQRRQQAMSTLAQAGMGLGNDPAARAFVASSLKAKGWPDAQISQALGVLPVAAPLQPTAPPLPAPTPQPPAGMPDQGPPP